MLHAKERSSKSYPFVIYPPSALEPLRDGQVMLPCPPMPQEAKDAVRPFVGPFPHRIVVLINRIHHDMFVDEMHMLERSTPNERATALYRSQFLITPDRAPPQMPQIYGPAVIFSQKVIEDGAWTGHMGKIDPCKIISFQLK